MLNNVWGALENKDVNEPGYLNFSIVIVEENTKLIVIYIVSYKKYNKNKPLNKLFYIKKLHSLYLTLLE